MGMMRNGKELEMERGRSWSRHTERWLSCLSYSI